jgi:hypothetical protein
MLLAMTPLVGFARVQFSPSEGATPDVRRPAAETITVTSTEDLDTSLSATCAANPSDPCTLRRAIVQARESTDKPATIAFDLPTSDNGYDSTEQVWVFEFSGLGSELRNPNGQIIIDGTTQSDNTDARPISAGPSVFIRGTPTAAQFTEIVFDGDANELRGVGFQYVRLKFNGSDNTIENNWLGLSLDGTTIVFPDDDPTRDNRASIETAENETGNLIQDNTLAGSRSGAISLRSDSSTVANNQIGTRADGTIPDVPEVQICRPNFQTGNWFGGDGINVAGDNNTISDNLLVAMLTASDDPNSTPPPAIEVGRSNNTIQNNQIGIQSDDTKRWVCGIGIRIVDEGHDVLNNEIYGAAGEGAIAIFGSQISFGQGGITLQGNIMEESTTAVFFGPTVPATYANFNPGKVTSISGTTVTGTNGDDGVISPGDTFPSTCANCTIEIFLDDSDGTVETLQSLGTTTSDTNGDWTFTLPAALADGEGLRTMTTTSGFDQISNLGPDTTTKVSDDLYGALRSVNLPFVTK